ncbi:MULTISPECIES: hypothetical protein [Gracilibacillus]|uniref:Uncharacterized protein n=1 Tax=Gracilibacillus dipsosauri TaxID=178340 RepID=A0A317KZL7_9BACI|nr:hypothetical protein [Gracilibacillus dipsosauri]PWU68783.1 hypothetical protein DLJ74_10195 [Gracilibacillus dipsosauri]
MVSLKDLHYDYSRVELKMELKEKVKVGATIRLSLDTYLSFGFSTIETNIIWTEQDIQLLKEQIQSIPLIGDSVDYLNGLEPDLSFIYIRSNDLANNELILFITLDSGQINHQIGTDSGPAIKLLTTQQELLKWITDLEMSFLKDNKVE